MKLNTVFQIIQGHQITDEEIYKGFGLGNIPIYTSSNQVKGYWDKAIIRKEDLPCISYPSKANSGEAFVQYDIFDANNTAVLVPLPEWRNCIILEWAALKLATIFLRVATSKGGVSYLNKDIIDSLDFEVPDKNIQQKEFKAISELIHIKMNCDKILTHIKHINNLALTVEYQKYQAKEVPASEIFSSISGNSGLTEEYIYSLRSTKSVGKYKLLTGSINVINTPMIPMCPSPHNLKEPIRVYQGDGIHVVRKGKAGYINYLPYDDYTLNDDAYILRMKDNCKLDISLNWLTNTHRSLFYKYATKSDNGTWSKTAFFKHASFDIPDKTEQDTTTTRITTLKEIENTLTDLNSTMVSILQRETT